VIEEESEERFKINSYSQSCNKSSKLERMSIELIPEPEMSVIVMPEPASAEESYVLRYLF